MIVPVRGEDHLISSDTNSKRKVEGSWEKKRQGTPDEFGIRCSREKKKIH